MRAGRSSRPPDGSPPSHHSPAWSAATPSCVEATRPAPWCATLTRSPRATPSLSCSRAGGPARASRGPSPRRSRDGRAARHVALRGCAGRAGRAGAAPGKGRAAARGIARRLRARHRAGALARAAAGRGRAAGRGAAQVGGREARAPPVRERRGVGGVDLERYLAARARLVERALAARFPPARTRLRQAMRYSLLAGGKRIRPVLALAAGEACGAPARRVLPFACALEMIHTYSLVHDDRPAMGDDDLRRGQPTSHTVWGEGLAILVGDALLTEAFRVMAGAPGVPPARALGAVAEVAAAAGEAGMVGGQALDLAAEGSRPSLRRVQDIHRRKTGALLRSAVRVGALVAGADARTLRRLEASGGDQGPAFQIADDILDAAGGPEADGRTDRELQKATYAAVLGTAGARSHLLRARDRALAALAPLGPKAAPLRALAVHVVARAAPAAAAS